LTLDGAGQLDIAAYWEPPGLDAALPGPAPSFDEAAAEVRDLLLAAVERRLLSDVPLGAFLSGGVDSASIVAMMTQLIPGQVRTFTMGFDDTAGFDERPLARETARFLGTDHTEFQVEADRTELIERLVWHHDQPFGDSSALPTYLLAEKTKEHVTVALSGDGGDELFAGYERFGAALLADRLKWVPTAITHSVLSGAGRVAALVGRPVGERAERFTNAFDEALPWPYLEWISMVPSAWRRRLLPRAVDFGELGYAEEWRATGDCSTLGRLQTVNLRTYLLDDLLPKMDRMSMAHALEVRSPFLDTRLLEYALSLPPEYRLRGLSLKRVLKRAVAGMLPPAVLRRRKHGFGLPLDRWFRTDLEAFVDGTLCAPSARISSHLDHQSVIDLVQAQRGGCPNLANAIWSLLTLEVFLRQQGW
jgi:asparagine synthase (glutamine-hydrolysing)